MNLLCLLFGHRSTFHPSLRWLICLRCGRAKPITYKGKGIEPEIFQH